MSDVATAHVAAETRMPNGKLAMWIFLASEVMFFSGLIGAYTVYRISNPGHIFDPGILNWPLAFVNTIVLITSSYTMVLAVEGAAEKNNDKCRKFLMATALLGLAFCVIKFIEYGSKFDHGLVPGMDAFAQSGSRLFLSCYFGMTGIHAIHVVGGIIPLLLFWWVARDGRFTREGNISVEILGLYWHFVDVVWIFLFPILYLLPVGHLEP